MNESPGVSRPAQKDNTTTCLIAGCGVFALSAILILVLVGTAAFFAMRKAGEMVDAYTSTDPAVYPPIEMDDASYAALESRVSEFGRNVDKGDPTPPLRLSANEINALIQRSNGMGPLSNGAFVSIKDGEITCSFSIPLATIIPIESFQDRFINGTGTLQISTSGSLVEAHIVNAVVNGKSLPESVAEDLAKKNLIEALMEDPNTQRIMGQIAAIDISDDAVLITPTQPTEAR
jgi:hypothetical protein